MKTILLSFLIFSLQLSALVASPSRILLEAESGQLHEDRVEVVEQTSFKSGQGVSLKSGVKAAVDPSTAKPDIVLNIRTDQPGRYVIRTQAAVDEIGRELMTKARTKHESMFMWISVGDAHATRQVVYVPWSATDNNAQTIAKYDLTRDDQQIRLWLPAGIRLDFVEALPYVPPAVPVKAKAYQPAIVPPPSRPRIWVNQDTLPQVRANLTKGDNLAVWQKVQEAARQPFDFKPEAGKPVGHDSNLEAAAVNKAFVYLMTGDKEAGRDAIRLANDYLQAVQFNNLLDITREIGRAMYAGARVYDWCYDLMSDDERASMHKNLMRLADDMEIGWPPFKQGVVNGHGSEAQLFCHLLSMAIAIYDEDPVPYKYCAYRILEELVPMRNFEYQSPRHHQGIGYGIYRFTWDMHAAWLMYRMSGQRIFDTNIEAVHNYWLYMRLPGGKSFPDGDGNVDDRRTNYGPLSLMTAAYANDPLMYEIYKQQGGLPTDPLMHLFLHDPAQADADVQTSLPLTLDFGKILGGMVARTGWDLSPKSSDVLVSMTGGGYHFSNHQQADAGSFQVYYRGMQVSDLGQYVFYGTPYDLNFNKRSIAHSMMLAYDPGEKVTGRRINDGGARTGFSSPASLEALKNPIYKNGTVLGADFGPSKDKPEFSYFSVDLESAYSDKITSYIRTFCFLNLGDADMPAALIIADHMQTSGSETRKYWQLNTLNPPEVTTDVVTLVSKPGEGDLAGYVAVNMLKPAPPERNLEVLSGKDLHTVFGHEFTPPKPEGPQANGHRLMFSPAKQQDIDSFLTVLTMSPQKHTTVPVELSENANAYILSLADRVVVLSKTGQPLVDPIDITVPGNEERLVMFGGLAPGKWTMQNTGGETKHNLEVQSGQGTAYIKLLPGRYNLIQTP